MAVVTGSLAALGTASKILAGASTKKALMSGAKNFLKDQAKDVIGDRITGRGRKKKKGGPAGPAGAGQKRPGALVKSGSVEIQPVDGIIPSTFSVIPNPEETKQVQPKSKGQVSFSTISTQLESIVSLTSMMEAVSVQGIKSKKKLAERTRKDNEKAKSKARENRLESLGKGALGFLGNKVKEGGRKSGIFNFLTQIFLGFIALKILPLVPGILKGIGFFTKNLHLTFLGFTGINEALKLVGKKVGKYLDDNGLSLKKLGDSIKNAFSGFKSGITKIFAKLGDIIPGFIKKGFEFARNVVRGAQAFGSKALQSIGAIGDTRSAALGASNKSLQKLVRPSNVGGAASKFTQQALQIRRLHGDDAALAYKSLTENGMSNAKAAKYVKKQIDAGKIASAPAKGSLGAGIKGSKIFKGGPIRMGKRAVIKFLGPSRLVRKSLSRIPIVGPLIAGLASLLAGEPAEQALFKGFGAFFGGILGNLIPIPIVGPIVGELIGEYFGDVMYTLLMGGGISAVGNKLKDDITNVMNAGAAAVEWVGRGFGRFAEGIPKFKIPEFFGRDVILSPLNAVLGGFLGGKKIQDFEIPNPFWMANPFNMPEKLGLFWKAFFTDDPMRKGDVKKEEKEDKEDKEDKNGGSSSNGKGGADSKDIKPTSNTTDGPDVTVNTTGGGNNDDPKVPMTMGNDFESSLAKLLKNYEGLRTQAYLDSVGIPTIGMGATYYPKGFRLSGKVQMGQNITEEEALFIKQAHIKEHRDRLLRELPASTYDEVPDNVKAALESKVFNYGSLGETLTKLVTTATEDGNYKPVSDYFRNSLARHNGGINSWRRNDEADLIDTGKSSRSGLSFPKQSGSKAKEIYEGESAKASSGSDTPSAQKPDTESTKAEVSKPDRSDPKYRGKSGAKQYAKDMLVHAEKNNDGDRSETNMEGSSPPAPTQQEESTKAEVSPTETMTGQKVTPTGPKTIEATLAREDAAVEAALAKENTSSSTDVSSMSDDQLKSMLDPTMMGAKNPDAFKAATDARKKAKEQGLSREETERAVLEATVMATQDKDQYNTHDVITPPTPPGESQEQMTPEISPITPPKSQVSGVEQETSYEAPQGSSSVMALPTGSQSGGGGASSGQSGQPVMMGSGNVLNSYYKSQLLGFLYKQG